MNETIIGMSVRYNLYDGIEEFDHYEDFMRNMCLYTESDVVNIHINCPGGRIDIAAALIDSMQGTKAKVRCILEQPSYSMGAIIALCGDELIMNPNTFLMFHNYSGGVGGKGSEMTQMVMHNDLYVNTLFENLCHPFLTKKELARINNDGDLYIYANDVETPKRIRRHFK